MTSLNFKPEDRTDRVIRFERIRNAAYERASHERRCERLGRRKRLTRIAWHVLAFCLFCLAALAVAGLSAGGR